jgi:predicted nucleic acid-binding protein
MRVVRPVLADTFYWIALTDPGDPWHGPARAASASLGPMRLVTTEPVLIELLNHFSAGGSYWRTRAMAMVDTIRQSPEIEVLLYEPYTTFQDGLALYAARADKEYSLTDCLSMQAMRGRGIFEVLTHDHHFVQEGFTLLLR